MILDSTFFFGRRLKFDKSHINKSSPLNLLIFTEHLNANYYLYFHYALEHMAAKRRFSFVTFTQDSVSKQVYSTLSDFVKRLIMKYKPDLVIFSRYAQPYGIEIINIFKDMGIPTLYHLDDYLLEIPDFLGEVVKRNHGAIEVIQERKKLMGLADTICVPTSELAIILTSEFSNQNIVKTLSPPFCEYLINKNVNRRISQGITVGYMGSKSHNHDLHKLTDTILRILDENTDVKFETFGTIDMPELLKQIRGRVYAHPVKNNYRQFLQYLYELNWDIGLAPLENNKFNNCKTPVKYIEYTACEIPTIASNINVYNSAINNSNGFLVEDNNWYQAISCLINDEELRKNIVKNAIVNCNSNFNIEQYYQKFLELLDLVITGKTG